MAVSFSGSTQLAGAGAVTATCSLWLSSRTWPTVGANPAEVPEGNATPSGSADFGPVSSGVAAGGPGGFTISAVTEGSYFLLVVYSGVNYWSGPYSIVDNSDVVHITGSETISGNKVFTGTVVVGKGTAVTTQTSGGATQNTIDDGSGNTTIKGILHADSASTTHPNVQFDTVAGGALSLGTNYGVDLDANSAIAINAKSGANGGVYTMRGGTKSVTVDDGSGNTSTAGLTVSGTLTYTGGAMSLPNAVIPAAAVIGGATSGAAVDVGSTQSITGPKTFDNDLTILGGEILGTQISSPSAPTITNVGTAGSTVALYKVVATTYEGTPRDSIPSDAGSTATGNATLNGTNYNTVSWSAVMGAASYTVLKWSGTAWQKLAGGVTGTSYNDQGGSLSAYVASTTNPGGEVTQQTQSMIGDLTNNGGKYIGNALSTPPTPSVTPTGGTGSTTYSYAVVGVSADGRDTLESTVGSTTTGVAFGSLTTAIYNLVQWTALSNVAGIRVIRTAGGSTQGQITVTLLPPTATSFKDTGLAAAAYSAATANPGGEISAQAITGTTGSFSGEVGATDFKPSGLTGATAATRYAGGTAAGKPASGTFATGDQVIDQGGYLWICTAGGSPGTWVSQARGYLGYAAITTTTATFTAPTNISGLSATVTVGTNRRVKVTAYAPASSSTVSTDQIELSVFESGSQLAGGYSKGDSDEPCITMAILTPSAGSHTYQVQGRRAGGTGNCQFYCTAAEPAFILVEDIGGA